MPVVINRQSGVDCHQQEFLDIVWQSRGMLVSSNTYYQNISILRKGLKRLVLKLTLSLPFPVLG